MREQGGGSGETCMFSVSSINQLQLEGCISIFRFFVSRFSNAFENKIEFFHSPFHQPSVNRHPQTTMHRYRVIIQLHQKLHALSLKTKTEREIESVQVRPTKL
jgi:hypothetical protein